MEISSSTTQSFLGRERQFPEVSIVMGYLKLAGWFISWKIPAINGWFRGTTISGNAQTTFWWWKSISKGKTSNFDGWITIFHGSTHLFWTISSQKISGSPQPVASHSHHHASRNREFHPVAATRAVEKWGLGGSIVMVIQWYPKKWTVWSWKIHLSSSIYGWFGGPWLRKSQEKEWGSKPKWETHRVKVNNIRCPTNKRLGFVSYSYLIYLTPKKSKKLI